jgi:hypothetical protein
MGREVYNIYCMGYECVYIDYAVTLIFSFSCHPYIFFNKDYSFTFVGFIINSNGDLVDLRQTVLEPRILTPQQYTGLTSNRVNFDEDCHQWKEDTMREKLATVMGIETHNPDESYVLTVDNLIKILAIRMRFRCGIPVVIMGETGCGKTRLIRYMCDLAREGREARNMLILKVILWLPSHSAWCDNY